MLSDKGYKTAWKIAYYSFVVLIILAFIFDWADAVLPLFPLMIIPLLALIFGAVQYFRYVRQINNLRSINFNVLDAISKPIAYVRYAYPGTSMLEALNRHGVPPDDIAQLRIQTGSIGNSYLSNRFIPHLKKFPLFDGGLEVEFVGYGRETECKAFLSEHRRSDLSVRVFQSSELLTTHFNLIETAEGELYSWFEPEHKDPAPGEIESQPEKGAFLSLVLTDKKQTAYDIFDNQKEAECH